MSITVVNCANIPINSATSMAGWNHSVHNKLGPLEYYIHDTLPGSQYTLRERWFCADNGPYEQDIGTFGSSVAGVLLASLGLVVAAAGAVAAVVLAAPTGGGSLILAATVAGYAGGAVTVATLVPTATVWGIQGSKVKAADDRQWDGIWGQHNRIFKISGNVPFTQEGNKVVSEDPNKFPLSITEMTQQEFDQLRSSGAISQTAVPLAGDMARLLRDPIPGADRVFGSYISMNKRYEIWAVNPGSSLRTLTLAAGEGEYDYQVYCIDGNARQNPRPNQHWQFFPLAPEQSGQAQQSFLICDRGFTRFLAATKNLRPLGGPDHRDVHMVSPTQMGGSFVNFKTNPPTIELRLDKAKSDWWPAFMAHRNQFFERGVCQYASASPGNWVEAPSYRRDRGYWFLATNDSRQVSMHQRGIDGSNIDGLFDLWEPKPIG